MKGREGGREGRSFKELSSPLNAYQMSRNLEENLAR